MITFIGTDPDLYVISGRVREFLTEPRWGVKSTAFWVVTALSIPESIIWEEYATPGGTWITCVTKVVISNKTWYGHSTSRSAWANMAVVVVTISVLHSICKAPYVFPGAAAMRHTHTFQIWSLYTIAGISCSVEATGGSILISSYSATNFAVGNTIWAERY